MKINSEPRLERAKSDERAVFPDVPAEMARRYSGNWRGRDRGITGGLRALLEILWNWTTLEAASIQGFADLVRKK